MKKLIGMMMMALPGVRSWGREVAVNALVLPADAKAPAYGSLIYFALDGDTVETETVSATDMPAGTVLTDWKELGCLESGTVEVQTEGGETLYCFDSTLGKHVPDDVVGETTSIIFNMTVQKITDFILQMSRHADTVNGTTGAITQNSQAGGHYKGYLLISQYNGTELVVSDQVRAHLSLSSAMPIHSRQGVKPQLRAVLIENANNTGALGTVVA